MGQSYVEIDPKQAWDEVFSEPGKPRPVYRDVVAEIEHYGEGELQTRFDQLGRTFRERGVTFAHDGEERPFPLDLIPRIISAIEWDTLSSGIQQRVVAVEITKLS
jgi:uncharacterized circularly permuted ATP-grasp superfamily protein